MYKDANLDWTWFFKDYVHLWTLRRVKIEIYFYKDIIGKCEEE